MKHLLAVAAVCALAFALPASAAGKGPASGELKASGKGVSRAQSSCGRINRSHISASIAGQSTASTVFVPVIGSDINFFTGNTGCVLLDCEAQVFSPGTGNLLIARAVLDGIPSLDGDVQLQSDSFVFSNTHGYNFNFVNVGPGNHNVALEYRSGTGSTVFINKFSCRADHR